MSTQRPMLFNSEVADLLEDAGSLLELQGANPYRAKSYSRAAVTIRALSTELSILIKEEGQEGLKELPGLGNSLSRTIERLVTTRRFPLLDRLRSQARPGKVLTTIGGIGPTLATRLSKELNINSLPELEAAVSNGKLFKFPGFGEKRVQVIRESLFGRLHSDELVVPKTPISSSGESKTSRTSVSVDVILDIDKEYRERALRHELPLLTPKQFNPSLEPWLPVLSTLRDGQKFTALYSNSLKAHQTGAIRDWVVMSRAARDGLASWTVITSQFGVLRGKRVVRSRENECKVFYHDKERRDFAA